MTKNTEKLFGLNKFFVTGFIGMVMAVSVLLAGCQMELNDEGKSEVSAAKADASVKENDSFFNADIDSWNYKKNVGEDYNVIIKGLTDDPQLKKAMNIPLSLANNLLDKYTFGLGTSVLGIFFQIETERSMLINIQKQIKEISQNLNQMRNEMNAQFAQLNGLVTQSTADIENLITTNVQEATLKEYLRARMGNQVQLNTLISSYYLVADNPANYGNFKTFANEFFGSSFISSQSQAQMIIEVIQKYFNPINGTSEIPEIWRNYYENRNIYRWGSNLSVKTQMLIEAKYALAAKVLTDAVLNSEYPNVKIYYVQNSILNGSDADSKRFYGCTWSEFRDAVCVTKADSGWTSYRQNYKFTDEKGKVLTPVVMIDGVKPSMVNPNDEIFKNKADLYKAYCGTEEDFIFQEYQNSLIKAFVEKYPELKKALDTGCTKFNTLHKTTMEYIGNFVENINNAIKNLPVDEPGYITLNFVDNYHKVYYRRVLTNIGNAKAVTDSPMSLEMFSHYHGEAGAYKEGKMLNAHTLVRGDLSYTGNSGLQELPYWYSACMLYVNHFDEYKYANNNCKGTVTVYKPSAESLSAENQLSILKGNIVDYNCSFNPGSSGVYFRFNSRNGVKNIKDLCKTGKAPANLFTKEEMEQIVKYFGTSGFSKSGLEIKAKAEKSVTYGYKNQKDMSYDCNIRDVLSKAFGISVPSYSSTFWDGANHGTDFEGYGCRNTEYITVTHPVQYKNLKIFVPVTGDSKISVGPNCFTVRGAKEGSFKLVRNADGKITNLEDCIQTSDDYEKMKEIAFVTPVIQNWNGNGWTSAN